ncbi:hypothetical protein HK405_013702 [Cladochytrium tenue]|nr:hypothetical protein HK405_013702 [Cladochytrium tenue]
MAGEEIMAPVAAPPGSSSAAAAAAAGGFSADRDSLRQFRRSYATVIAASASSVVGVLAGYPFDLVKTRMQTIRYASADACIKEIYSHEGFLGFFRGIGPIIVTVSFLRSLSFTVYTNSKVFLVDEIASNSSQLVGPVVHTWTLPFSFSSTANPPETASSYPGQGDIISQGSNTTMVLRWQLPSAALGFASALSGAAAGSVIATVNAPFDFIKILRQLETARGASAPTTAEVAPVVTKGHVPTASPQASKLSPAGHLREPTTSQAHSLPGTSAAAGPAVASSSTSTTKGSIRTYSSSSGAGRRPRPSSAYHWAKKIVALKGFRGLYLGYPYHLTRDLIGTASYFFGYESLKLFLTPVGGTPGPYTYMLAGGISGTLSWVFLYPFDLVKSVMQREALKPIPKYSSALEFVRRRLKSGGIRGFYHGVGAQLTRSFPVHSLNFLVYEQVLAWCKSA